jgi:hypothetical protein
MTSRVLCRRASVAAPESWLSKRDIAAHLGFSVRWVEYRVGEGMPHKVLGGRLRFQRSTVESWLEQREQRPRRMG